MALQKEYITPQGVSGNYWRIEKVSLEPKDKRAYIDIFQYLDSSSASTSAGSTFLDSRSYFVSNMEYTTWFDSTVLNVLNQNPQERAYEYLKDRTSTSKTQVKDRDFTIIATDLL